MQHRQLSLTHVFHRAERYFGHKAVVTVGAGGQSTTSTIADVCDTVRRLATAFERLGVRAEARVGSFCWNTATHLALYMAAPCTGRILHTLNIRLHAEQLAYIVNHAEDEIIFVDRSLLESLWPLADKLDTVRHYVVIDDGAECDIPDDPRIVRYEALTAGCDPYLGAFEIADEDSAALLCYTSGTTGNPKGVLYSHRSTLLHSLIALTADVLGISERDVVMPIVPMFHANAWGLPYACLLAGAQIVLPGPQLTPRACLQLLEEHRVTVTAAVPTIWMNALPMLTDYDLSALRVILCGGSAVPKALSEAYRQLIGIRILQAWGMTETSPLATVSRLRTHHDGLSEDEQADICSRQGQAVPLVDIRLVDPESGCEVPWDGTSTGEVQAAGPWIAGRYFRGDDSDSAFTSDGWLRTGDLGVCDEVGFVRLVDRTKDLVKSGGEWISSVDLENEIMSHPKIAEAAVIAVAHAQWVERPLACVVVKPGESMTSEEVIEHLRSRVAKWWLPDAVEFIAEVPKTSVGKFSKKALRERFGNYRLPE